MTDKHDESPEEIQEIGLPQEEAEAVEVPDPLEKKLEQLEQENSELQDRWLRKQAEFENFRRRVVREKSDLRHAAMGEVLRELLTVIDACQRGLESVTQAGTEDPSLTSFVEGYELLAKSLGDLLKRFGVESVPGVGSEFDPNFHEAVIREETTDHPDGQVIDEFRKGYQIQGRLLRPSQVKVAVEPAPQDA